MNKRLERRIIAHDKMPLLMLQEPLFTIDSPRIARQLSVSSNHPVTGHDDRDRVASVGGTDGARSGRLSQSLGQGAVGDGFAKGDLAQELPDLLLKGSALRSEGEVKGLPQVGEVLVKLFLRLVEQFRLGGFAPLLRLFGKVLLPFQVESR